jgi:hypothetical protein
MPKTCLNCKAVVSKDAPILSCGACRSAVYCSKVCQKKDWKEGEHKKICKYLNVGEGAMQVRRPIHMENLAKLAEGFKETERSLDYNRKRFFTLFTESTFEGRQAAARKMKKIAAGQTKRYQQYLLLHSLYLLIHTDSEKLLWPNSPLLVLLQFVDPNMLYGNEPEVMQEGETIFTPLHHLAFMADPTISNYSTQVNQLTLGRQLIEHGANANTCACPGGDTPLHSACHSSATTNLDFIELLLKKGADPNAQDHTGMTPLMHTNMFAPGSAKFLLEWETTDVNITTSSGVSFLAKVRSTTALFSQLVAIPDDPDWVKNQFLLHQWREIEEMLVEMGADDTGIVD